MNECYLLFFPPFALPIRNAGNFVRLLYILFDFPIQLFTNRNLIRTPLFFLFLLQTTVIGVLLFLFFVLDVVRLEFARAELKIR